MEREPHSNEGYYSIFNAKWHEILQFLKNGLIGQDFFIGATEEFTYGDRPQLTYGNQGQLRDFAISIWFPSQCKKVTDNSEPQVTYVYTKTNVNGQASEN
jgi:hypothetical protein